MADRREDSVAETYLALRMAPVILVGLLFASVLFRILATDGRCYQISISAYYYTPVRPVFIAALCAIGVCLIINHGSTPTENVALDFCGFFAFVVAFVPTPYVVSCGVSNVPTERSITIAVGNNIPAVFVAAVAAVWWGWKMVPGGPSAARRTIPSSAKVSLAITVIALAIGIAYYVLRQDDFLEAGHFLAAVGLFTCIVWVVSVNAWDLADPHRRLDWFTAVKKAATNRYGLVVISMVLSGAVAVLTRWPFGFAHWVFLIEALLILEFAVFWTMQTNELKGAVARQPPAETMSST